jgi:hypothetical protein
MIGMCIQHYTLKTSYQAEQLAYRKVLFPILTQGLTHIKLYLPTKQGTQTPQFQNKTEEI